MDVALNVPNVATEFARRYCRIFSVASREVPKGNRPLTMLNVVVYSF